jgi:general secretion pathway protein M
MNLNVSRLFGKGTAAPPYVAALAYAGLVLVLLVSTLMSWSGVLDRKAAVTSLEEVVQRLEGRNPATSRSVTGDGLATGSYFLEGPTVTVAGAALLERVVGAVAKYGGSVLSSQVDLQGDQSKSGFITVIANYDIGQPELQQLLYDLEAGMPFLFVDQLVVQTSPSSATSDAGKLRVLLSVSGQWHGAQ